MSYAQYGLVEATDYNNLIGNTSSTTANLLNTTWATGSGSTGYGQTALANVSQGNQVTATQWANLVNTTSNAALHQGSTITSVTAPVSGGTITFLSAIPTNLQTIYTNRLNAGSQGSTTANAISTSTSWSNIATFTHTVTFASGDAARYFFNAGGQLNITCSHPAGTGINLLLNNLASNVGTIVMSAPSSGTVSIVGTSYPGISKVGGGGNSPTISASTGYYSLTTSNATVFTQTASTGPSSYLGTFIRVIAKSNGPQGSNADAGSIITLYTIWDEIPNGLAVASGSTVTCTARFPETTYIANTVGSINIAGVVSVS